MSLLYYSAFGYRLGSTLPLPELRPTSPGPTRWNFSVVDRLPELEDATLLGEDPIYGSVSAKLFRHSAGHRILIDDTGSYDLCGGNRDIRWKPTDDPWWDFGRSHLIGRVIATSLQLSGIVTLHASAVEMKDGVIGFLAPKHFGKSTLATMLLRAGARFVTDDSLAVSHGARVLAHPGIQSIRARAGDGLLDDAAQGAPGRDGKVMLPLLAADRVLEHPTRISGLYFLRPADPTSAAHAVERSAVPSVPAAVRLIGQSKIGGMLGHQFVGELLEAATAVASRVPVHELSVVRDLDRLPEVVDRLVAWHGVPTTTVSA